GAQPGNAAAWIGLAKASGRAGRYRAMHAAALRALEARPATWPHALALARLLRDLHETRALAGLSTALADDAGVAPGTPDAMVALADLLVDEDLHGHALAWLDRAVAMAPGHAPARYVRGSTRLFLGDMAGAREDLEHAIAAAPHFAHAPRRLSQLRAQDRPGATARVERLYAERPRVAPGSEHDIHFSHALFDELHDLGEHEAAWAALERGMRAKRATLRYDVADDLRLVDAIRDRCDAGFIGRPMDGTQAPAPVFIVGLFRSGSTVLERMLGGHPSVSEGGESMGFAAALRLAADHRGHGLVDTQLLDRLDAIDWPALGRDFMAANAWRARGRGLWTEKLPTNALLLGCIARALPQARFLHATRAPMDVCFSNLRMLYGGFARWSYDQHELAAWHQAHAALMAHWHAVLGPRLLDVRHADLLRDPAATMRQVLGHLGLGFDPAVLKPERSGGSVATASAA